MNLQLTNTSTNFQDQSVSVSVSKASTQPPVLSDSSTTYNFNHISKNDDEGIYMLNTNHTGNVLGFLMTNMGDNASISLNLFTKNLNLLIGDTGVSTEGMLPYIWNNNTYKDPNNMYHKYWREVALLADGYAVMQDSSGSSFPYQNQTQFTMKYDVFPAINLSQEFTKGRGRDLVLLRAELDYNTSLHVHEISGKPQIATQFFGYTEDGIYHSVGYSYSNPNYKVYFAPIKATYFIPITMDTSNGWENIGTFMITSTGTIPDVTGLGAIPGYPIFITLTISAFLIGIIAYLQRRKRL
jgi:hypothetical protein